MHDNISADGREEKLKQHLCRSTKLFGRTNDTTRKSELKNPKYTKKEIFRVFVLNPPRANLFLLMSSRNWVASLFLLLGSLQRFFYPSMETFQSFSCHSRGRWRDVVLKWQSCSDCFKAYEKSNWKRFNFDSQKMWIVKWLTIVINIWEKLDRFISRRRFIARYWNSPWLSYVVCMHTPVVLTVLNICKFAVLVRSLVSNQLRLDMEHLWWRLLDLS